MNDSPLKAREIEALVYIEKPHQIPGRSHREAGLLRRVWAWLREPSRPPAPFRRAPD